MKKFAVYFFALCFLAGMSSCGKTDPNEIPFWYYDPFDRFLPLPENPGPSLASAGRDLLNIDTARLRYWYERGKRAAVEIRWRHNEYWYEKKCTKWLKRFYADLYACGGNMQTLSEKYAENLDSVLLPTLTAAYAKANNGADGLDWTLFDFNSKDSAEVQQIKVSYSKDHWFNVWLIRKDTLKLKVRIEDYRPKVIINGLLNPQRNVIMTPFDRMKIQALVRLYHNLGEYTEKDFTERYAITFTPDLLDALRYHDRDGYDWDKLKIGKEKFTDIRDEDVTYLGDDWFLIAPLRHKVGFIALQVKVAGLKFKVTGFKVPDQPL